jgi:predicted naringenin-chalcone synthase
MTLAILGLGTALPTFTIRQDQAAGVAQVLCLDPRQAPVVPVLYRHTEIEERHMVLSDQILNDILNGTRESNSVFLPSGADNDPGPTTQQRMEHYVAEAGPLAVTAARQALAESGIAADDFTHLVTVSCTGFSAPGVDFELIRELGLPPTVERTHVGFMGCHGALNGLRVARSLAMAEPGAKVLLCAVELCSIHYYYGWNPKRVVSNALFGDGAAALVGIAGPSDDHWQVAANGAKLFPQCAEAMTWNIGNHGFDMTLSTRVPALIESHLRPWLESWLQRHGLTVNEVGSWAIHPGGPRILVATGRALGLDRPAMAASFEVLTRCGNMSSPTVLFILDRLRRQGAKRPCVALGFGPGLAVEAALFQ